jgi:hypothetical protein
MITNLYEQVNSKVITSQAAEWIVKAKLHTIFLNFMTGSTTNAFHYMTKKLFIYLSHSSSA